MGLFLLPSLGQGQQHGNDLHTTEGAGKNPLLRMIRSQAPPSPVDYEGLCVPHITLTRFSGKPYVAFWQVRSDLICDLLQVPRKPVLTCFMVGLSMTKPSPPQSFLVRRVNDLDSQ